jgi:hypothetical protein
VRPLAARSFSSLSEAEEENGQSRIYLGIHWTFDKTEGIAQGRRIADYVLQNAFTPVQKGKPIGFQQLGGGRPEVNLIDYPLVLIRVLTIASQRIEF